jgi:hypothetical protein
MDGSTSCCDAGPLVIRRHDGVVASLARIPFGQEVIASRSDRALPARCHDCGATPGGLHHLECCVQQCPACLAQLMSCQCIYKGDEDWDPRWVPTSAGGEEPWDDDMPPPGEDPDHPCPKCGSVPFAPADGSGRWCRACNWSWMIGVPGDHFVAPLPE